MPVLLLGASLLPLSSAAYRGIPGPSDTWGLPKLPDWLLDELGYETLPDDVTDDGTHEGVHEHAGIVYSAFHGPISGTHRPINGTHKPISGHGGVVFPGPSEGPGSLEGHGDLVEYSSGYVGTSDFGGFSLHPPRRATCKYFCKKIR